MVLCLISIIKTSVIKFTQRHVIRKLDDFQWISRRDIERINRQSKKFYPSTWISLNENSFNIYYKAFVIHRESLAAYGPRADKALLKKKLCIQPSHPSSLKKKKKNK